jgi:hypothetical protein
MFYFKFELHLFLQCSILYLNPNFKCDFIGVYSLVIPDTMIDLLNFNIC